MPYVFPMHKVFAARVMESMFYVKAALSGALARDDRRLLDAKSVLLIEPFQLGDVVSLSSVLQPLKDMLPDARLVLLTQASTADVLRADPRIDDVIACPFPWVRGNDRSAAGWRACLKALRAIRAKGGFDVGIDTRGDVRSHWAMVEAGCRRRVGYTNYAGSNMRVRGLLLTDNVGDLAPANRFLLNREVVARAFGTTLPAPDFPLFLTPRIAPVTLADGKRQVLVHPGAGMPHRQWEPQKWAAVVNHLARRPDVHVVLAGGPGDKAAVEAVRTLAPGTTTRITTLQEFLALLKGSTLFVGMDSGPMNVAVSMGIPVVAIFGPSDHRVWAPLGERSRWITKYTGESSDPALVSSPGDPPHESLQRITADDVIRLVDDALADGG